MDEQKHNGCFTDEDKRKLFTELGYIKKGVENNERSIRTQNGNVAEIRKMVNRHEVFIGKIGAITAAMAFFASIVFTALINMWFRVWKP